MAEPAGRAVAGLLGLASPPTALVVGNHYLTVTHQNGDSAVQTLYVVQPGDTLSGIAQRFGVGLAALEAANPQITDPNRIFPGQVLNIPGPRLTYVVQAGDTLSGIAQRFGVGLAALEAWNPQITDPNVIFPGQVINIP